MTFPLTCRLYLLRPQSLAIAILALGLFGGFCSPISASAEATVPVTPTSSSMADPREAIVVGPRELVGKPSLGQKAASNVVGGLIGSVLGGSSRKSAQPKTKRDPSRKLDYNNLAAGSFDTETQARGMWTKDGLLISARVEESPGKGTFQSLFLESCDGRRLYPQRYEIYDLWNESSLSVSWSSTSTSNGKIVSQQSGQWSDSWNDDFSSISGASVQDPTEIPGTWQQLGFDRAQGGVRQIGAYFNVTAAELANMGELGLFVHTTRPTQDPVTTVPAHWQISPGNEKQPLLSAVILQSEPLTESDRWQTVSATCQQQQGLLLAAASPGPGSEPFPPYLPTRLSGSVTDEDIVATTGFPLPAGLTYTAKGTGRTTGHIITLTVINPFDHPVEWPSVSFFAPSDGRYQSYVGRTPATPVPAGSTVEIPVTGYCSDVRKPPVPAGEAMPPPSDWIVVTGPIDNIQIPPRAGAGTAGRAMIPGTDTAVPRAVSQNNEPLLVAPLLLAAMTEVEKKTAELQASGDLQTPFSGNPEREREAVIQQIVWIYASELEGEPYTKEEFTRRLEQQYEISGTPIAAAPPEDQQRVQQGADDFWDAFELVGIEAKVFNHEDPSAPATGATVPVEAKPAPLPGQAPPPEELAGDGCPGNKHIHHTDRQVDVKIANSYGDDESRQKIISGIRDSVASNETAYVTSTPPSTAYSIWRDDHIGGISSAYAKVVFLEKNDQEWVWSTDPMTTKAGGTGTHTLSFQPGPQCKATVAGAASMWIKSSSEAFDPLARNIEVFRALDAVKELSVKYVTRKLPPGIDDAIEAGVKAITDPASDTYAGASGTATLKVGTQQDHGQSSNRVVYKRKDKEDKAIIGGGATVKKLFVSDVKPNSLTSSIEAEAMMEAGATGNGFAKAYLESVYGTLLVGVCECPDFTSYEILTDSSMFIRSDAVKGAVDVAMREMQEAAERIGNDIESGEQDTSAEELKKRVENELKSWAEKQAGERFKPEEAKDDFSG